MRKSLFVSVSIVCCCFVLSGCVGRYSTSSPRVEQFDTVLKLLVRSEIVVAGSGAVVHTSNKHIGKSVLELLDENPVFEYSSSSDRVLKIKIQHANDDAIFEQIFVNLLRVSYYLLPFNLGSIITDSDVKITITLDDISSTYKGELVTAYGLIGMVMVSSNDEYATDRSKNVLKNLIKNALDKFTVEYLASRA